MDTCQAGGRRGAEATVVVTGKMHGQGVCVSAHACTHLLRWMLISLGGVATWLYQPEKSGGQAGLEAESGQSVSRRQTMLGECPNNCSTGFGGAPSSTSSPNVDCATTCCPQCPVSLLALRKPLKQRETPHSSSRNKRNTPGSSRCASKGFLVHTLFS